MKLILKSKLLLFCLLQGIQLKAQTPSNQLEFAYGMSLKSGLIKTVLNQKKNVEVSGPSVVIFGYERRLAPVFGLGLNYTTQTLSGSYLFEAEVNNQTVDESMFFEYKRYAIVIEPKFYYPLKMENLELYTSLRLGFKKEKIDANTTNNTLNEVLKLTDLLVGNPVNASITPLGINYFPIKNAGIGLAGNFGPTYFTKASIFLRF